MTSAISSAFSDTALLTEPAAPPHRWFPAEVLSNELIAGNVRRITLHARDIASWTMTGPDEFFGLLMPQSGVPIEDLSALLHVPAGSNLRAVLNRVPQAQRPDLRWYTVRQLDRASCRLSFDVVTHGVRSIGPGTTAGPGLTWATCATPGDKVGVWTVRGLWHRAHQRQLLVADAAAMPSIRSILEFQATHNPTQLSRMHVVAIVESDEDIEPGMTKEWVARIGSLSIIRAPLSEQADAAETAMATLRSAGHPAAHPEYVWVGGEGTMCKLVRAMAVREWGLDRQRILWCPYWLVGRPRP
ncbi:siderophore-interacting protein [Corynebacterium heidelbergense]|uniref:Siderophore-interacting protein n=1 Tax=Corynebacterium heidelbergense TaxID=2055947 RepID=A0A364V9R1_9CORY|nr:siderophore-interacting protein [Corynebacterium heidelbergense]RAV33348.1 siderophore-interacting protein [Corynebacterium heidelbergense]WCZ37328.1 NADPH-dependent ferric-chelate reductase [Corynebacterium heidelbergense]